MRCSKKHQQLLAIPSILTTQPLTAESQRRSSPSTREPNSETGSEIAARAKRDDGARRLMSIPGIGPLIATAIEALAPPVETFRSGRDFAAWVGLTPLQHSTGQG